MTPSAVLRPLVPLLGGLLLAACGLHHPAVQEQPVPRPTPMRAQPTGSTAVGQVQTQRLLVRRGAMSVDVDDVAQSVSRAHGVAVSTGGYVEREERGEKNASLTIRVPEARLEAALDTLAGLGKVTSRTLSAQDVTEEAIDVEARVRTLTASRDRIRELLERASTVADVVAVEKELARIQAELESLQGRLQHLRGSASLAELYVSFHRKVVLGPLGWLAAGIGRALEKLFVIR